MPKRRTLPQDCIVCGEDPCACTEKVKRPKRPPRQRKAAPEPHHIAHQLAPDEFDPNCPVCKPEPDEPVVVALKPSAVDAMRRASQSAELQRRKIEPLEVRSKTSLSEDQAVMIEAVRLLDREFGPLEGPDADRLRPYLNREPTPGERAAAWRARRRGDS